MNKNFNSFAHSIYHRIAKTPKSIQAGIRRALLEVRYAFKSLSTEPGFRDAPVFIVGCGHSGTSLLLSILGAHPKLYDVPHESYFAFKDESEAHTLLNRFRREAIAMGCSRWVEKTPKHVRRIETILQYKPSAKVIVMLRDGRDVACSIRDRTGDFKSAVERWFDDNKRAENYLHDERVERFKYEDLVQNFKQTITSVCRFIEEEYTHDMKRFHDRDTYYYDWRITKPSSPENHERLRNWQVNQPLFDGSGRWKDEMSENEKTVFKRLAGDMLVRYGYAGNGTW